MNYASGDDRSSHHIRGGHGDLHLRGRQQPECVIVPAEHRARDPWTRIAQAARRAGCGGPLS